MLYKLNRRFKKSANNSNKIGSSKLFNIEEYINRLETSIPNNINLEAKNKIMKNFLKMSNEMNDMNEDILKKYIDLKNDNNLKNKVIRNSSNIIDLLIIVSKDVFEYINIAIKDNYPIQSNNLKTIENSLNLFNGLIIKEMKKDLENLKQCLEYREHLIYKPITNSTGYYNTCNEFEEDRNLCRNHSNIENYIRPEIILSEINNLIIQLNKNIKEFSLREKNQGDTTMKMSVKIWNNEIQKCNANIEIPYLNGLYLDNIFDRVKYILNNPIEGIRLLHTKGLELNTDNHIYNSRNRFNMYNESIDILIELFSVILNVQYDIEECMNDIQELENNKEFNERSNFNL